MLTLPDSRDGKRHVSVPAGAAAYLASLVRELRARNPLSVVVAAGDLIGASPLVSSLFHDEPAIEVLNEIGLVSPSTTTWPTAATDSRCCAKGPSCAPVPLTWRRS